MAEIKETQWSLKSHLKASTSNFERGLVQEIQWRNKATCDSMGDNSGEIQWQ